MSNVKKFQIVSCSGASNTGKYADEIARRLATEGDAHMICLAKVAISDQPLINQIKSCDSKIIVLDGCPFNCAEIILGREGITDIVHLKTTGFGIIKGKTPFSKERADEIINYIKTIS